MAGEASRGYWHRVATRDRSVEIEVARVKKEDYNVPETLELSLNEGKRVTAASRPNWSARKPRKRANASGAVRLRIDFVQQGMQPHDVSIPV